MTNRIRGALGVAVVTASLAVAGGASAQFKVTNTNLGAIFGPAHPYLGFYAADLGFTAPWVMPNGSSVQVVFFGDTYTDIFGNTPANANDAVAYFPTGPIGSSAVSLSFFGMAQVHDQPSGVLENMGGGKTPVAAFTSVNKPFGVFGIAVPQTCTSNSQCNGLKCDSTMGGVPTGVGNPWSSYLPCWLGHSANLACQPIFGVLGVGLCRDQTSSVVTFSDPAVGYYPVPGGPVYNDSFDGAPRTEAGKIYTVASILEIGATDASGNNFATYPYVTNRFLNMSARASVSDTDYTRPTSTSATNTVWVWGKPNFYSNASRAGRSELYLAKASSPQTTGPISLLYYAANGTWSSLQTDAIPLSASGGWEDGAAGDMGITYLAGRKQWVMFYGGGVPPVWAAAFGGVIRDSTNLSPTDGSIKMRTAPDPWGPWSPPQVILAPTDPIIFSTFCNFLTGASCNPATFPAFQNTPGALYASQIVEEWDQSDAGTADLGWFVSLWDPYQVQQMKTHIQF
jgi:hypothetical protein